MEASLMRRGALHMVYVIFSAARPAKRVGSSAQPQIEVIETPDILDFRE